MKNALRLKVCPWGQNASPPREYARADRQIEKRVTGDVLVRILKVVGSTQGQDLLGP